MLARYSAALHSECIILDFAAIILTVWLPGNIIANYIIYNVKGVNDIGVLN
jgi:hypothetical protein